MSGRSPSDSATGLTGAAGMICGRVDATSIRCVFDLEKVFDGERGRQSEVELPHPIKQLAVGGTHACAAVDNGDLYCWGDNRDRKLGTRPVQNTPLDVTDRFAPAPP